MSDSEFEDDYSTESISDEHGVDKPLNNFFSQKELCYYTIIDKFFKERCGKSDIKLMTDIISSKSIISLRILDWFASKHSKQRNKLDFTYGKKESFDVRISYDAQLRTYKKKYFDPFRRKKKFRYEYDIKNKAKKILTTIGQLNFFKWAIDTKILDFVKGNFNSINEEMKKNTKSENEKKRNKKKKKVGKKGTCKNKKKTINVKAHKIEDDDDVEIVLNFI